MNSRKKKLYTALKIITVILIVLLILLLGIRIGEKIAYASFYSDSEKAFATPGMDSGFVGQGLDYDDDSALFLSCGYDAKKGKSSMVYQTDENGKSTCTRLKKLNGENYTGHTGGLAHYGEYVYITGSDGLDVFKLSDFTEKKSEATQIGKIKCPEGHDPAFVTIHNGMLYEGSFYRAGNYETPENERVTTPAGDNNTAMIYAYPLNETLFALNFGVSPVPVKAYSTRGLVQGMTFRTDGGKDVQAILSCSWGLSTSHLYFYDLTAIPPVTTHTVEAGGLNIPLYFLDSSCLADTVETPPMSEEIVFKDEKLYIMTESASNKYIFGKFMSGNFLYAYNLAQD